MAAHLDHIVDASLDPEVAILVASSAVGGEVVGLAGSGVFDARPVIADEALAVAVDAAEHAGPWLADDEETALVRRQLLALLADDRGVDPEHRKRARAGLGGDRPGDRRADVAGGFGLPIGVDDRTSL